MKIKNIFSGLLSLLLMCSLMGCQGSSNANQEIKEIRVGVLLYNQDDLFISKMTEELDKGFREKEKEGDFKITFNFSDANGSQTMQNDQIDRYISQGYDVLCVNLVDRTDAAVIVDKGKKADIPIVFFNREPVSADMERWEKTYYVGINAEEGGKLQGEIFLEGLKEYPEFDTNGDGVIQYVMLEGEPGHQDTTIRTESCIKTIQEAGIELERLGTESANWRRNQAKEIMEDWLDQFGDRIEAVFSNNDEMALGVVDVLDQQPISLQGIPVIGLDGVEEAVEEVREGGLLGTVLNDAKGQAKGVIDLAVALGMDQEPTDIEYLQKDRTVRVPQKIVK